MKVGDKIVFNERSTFLLGEGVSKEKGNDNESSNEEGIKSMSFDKDCDLFIKAFSMKIESSLIYLFQQAYFLDDETLAGADEMIDISLQEDDNFEEARWSNVCLEHVKEEYFSEGRISRREEQVS